MKNDSREITAAGIAPAIPRRLRERLMRGKLHKEEDAQVLRTGPRHDLPARAHVGASG